MVKKNKGDEKPETASRLGFWGLTALVFGMMVGAGIFNLPQNMAAGAGLGAVIAAWGVTAVGMLLLVATFKTLADRRPDLDDGIYQYARSGWGNYVGFNVAWGYWLCAAFANVAYAVMLYDAFSSFFPMLHGNNSALILFGSLLIWLIYFLVGRGFRTFKIVNTILALFKVCVILLIVALIAANVKIGMLSADFWGELSCTGGFMAQVESTMLVTLWCFIGIEGAVMMSGRARRARDVGRAGVTGFFIAWALYLLVSVLSFGVMTRAGLAGLDNPSAAYVLRGICGDWAYWLVIVAVIFSLLGGWVAWTVICAQMPYKAAMAGIFPRGLRRVNRHGMPVAGLFASSVVMQLFLLLVAYAQDVYLTALSITGMMILPAYLLSGMYLWKASLHPAQLRDPSPLNRRRFLATGVACTFYCLWMIYAGGVRLFFETSVFYFCGIALYIIARREQCGRGKWFTRNEKLLLAVIVVSSVVTLVTGQG